jgi:hypothetical protein
MDKATNEPHIPPNKTPAVQHKAAHRDFSGTVLALSSKNPVAASAISTGFLDNTLSRTPPALNTSCMVKESVTAQDAQERRYQSFAHLLCSGEH